MTHRYVDFFRSFSKPNDDWIARKVPVFLPGSPMLCYIIFHVRACYQHIPVHPFCFRETIQQDTV